MKDVLRSPPIMALSHPTQYTRTNFNHGCFRQAISLSQMIDGTERIIELGARGLRYAEKKYSDCEKELVDVVTGVNYYDDYLNGNKFLIRMDNVALKYLNIMKHTTGRLGRWNLLLSGAYISNRSYFTSFAELALQCEKLSTLNRTGNQNVT